MESSAAGNAENVGKAGKAGNAGNAENAGDLPETQRNIAEQLYFLLQQDIDQC